MNYSPPGPSVHGISQARIKEWVAISSSSGIFLAQGLNLWLLYWQAVPLLLSHRKELFITAEVQLRLQVVVPWVIDSPNFLLICFAYYEVTGIHLVCRFQNSYLCL